MIVKKRPRYYCEFCKKSGASSYHMKKHEAGCTNNPNRICGMCREMGETQKPIQDLIAALGKGDKQGLDNLREVSNNCPVCILAAIRQSGLQHEPDGEMLPDGTGYYDPGFRVDFDFKKEKDEFWKQRNEEIRNRNQGYW